MQTYERTHSEAVLAMRYSTRYCLLQRRLFARISSLFLGLELVAGSAAFAAWLGKTPALAAAAGLVLAMVAAANIVISPADKRVLCELQRRRWTALDARAPALALDELQREIAQLRLEELPEIESLRQPAYNGAMRENGRTDAEIPLKWRERLAAAFA